MAPQVQNLMNQVANRSSFTSALGLGLRRLGTFGAEGPGIMQLSMLPQGDTLRRNRQLGCCQNSGNSRSSSGMHSAAWLTCGCAKGELQRYRDDHTLLVRKRSEHKFAMEAQLKAPPHAVCVTRL